MSNIFTGAGYTIETDYNVNDTNDLYLLLSIKKCPNFKLLSLLSELLIFNFPNTRLMVNSENELEIWTDTDIDNFSAISDQTPDFIKAFQSE